jgi:hypothetical protein
VQLKYMHVHRDKGYTILEIATAPCLTHFRI